MPSKHGGTGNRYLVPMAVKTLRVLEVFRGGSPRLSLTDVVTASGIPKASAFRILETLCYLGYVSRTEHGLYRLTFRLMDIAGVVQERNLLRKLATPFLKKLQRQTSETVNLGVLEGDEVVYVDVLESSHSLRMVPRVGSTAPFHATALGKVIAAHLAAEDIARLMRKARPRRMTDRTITSDARLREELARIRERGVAVDDQEEINGCTCVGAAILDIRGGVLGAVSISAPSSRTPAARLEQMSRDVLECAQSISERFCFTRETPTDA